MDAYIIEALTFANTHGPKVQRGEAIPFGSFLEGVCQALMDLVWNAR